jgi:uncharacterized membrane protein
MKRRDAVLYSAIASVFALGATTGISPAFAKDVKMEKCYGIAKAGKNDCQTAYSACAGTSKKDGESTAWLYVPQGTCKKIVGGTLEPKPNKDS